MTVDYPFYRDAYQGDKLTEAEFTRLRVKARAYVDGLTLGRACEEDAARLAVCGVADAMRQNEQGGGVAGETVGRYTVNYVAGVSMAGTDASRLYEAAALFLRPAGLIGRWA